MEWSTIGQISTGFALVAFMAAIAGGAYRATLRSRIGRIEALPPKDRILAVERELNSFGVDASRLTREQQYKLALRELDLRARKTVYLALVVALVCVVSGGVAVYALKLTPAPPPSTELVDPRTWQTTRLCRDQLGTTAARWRQDYLRPDEPQTFYVIVKSFEPSAREEEAARYATTLRRTFPQIDADAMLTTNPAGGNQRWAVVVARAVPDLATACRIRSFAASCVTRDQQPYVNKLFRGAAALLSRLG